MTDIKRVGVLGCGLMGSGIAQVAATAGYDTVVRDVSQQVWDKARAGIERSLAKFVEKGKLPAADRDAGLKRLRFTTTTAELKGCDIVLEAVTEDLDLKNALWKELDGVCPPATIFASNTSSLTIAAMAAATRRADRFVGLHFFNPVPLMPLVEVVRTVTTSTDTFQRAFAFAKSLGKEPVAAKDNSGFIVNLLLVPYLLDAIRAVERGVGSVPDIDTAMRLGCGERPPGCAAARDRAVRHRRLAHKARIAQGRGAVDTVGRCDRRVGGRARWRAGRRRHRARRGDPRPDGDARDAGAHDHGHLHGRARVEAVPPRAPHASRGGRVAPTQRRGPRDRDLDRGDRWQDDVRARGRCSDRHHEG